MADSECPSTLFAQSLKTIDYSSGEGIVTEYDHALLEAKCRRSSSEFESSLDLDLIVKELFRADEWWANRELILQSLTLLGKVQGFRPAKNRNTIICNRQGDKEYDREYPGGGLKAGCTLLLNLKPKYSPKK